MFDSIELELARNLLEAAAEQMGITLGRAAFSANIKERRDYSCAVFDSDGELLAQAAHIPVHLGSMPACVAAVRGALGDLDEGDVAIVNDPFAGGTHLPDVTLVSPVFAGGVRVGYAANRAHHADVGGTTPGSMTLSRHIDEEGVRIGPALLVRGGVRDAAVLGRLLAAVRTPGERVNDLEAQLAATAGGGRALAALVARPDAAGPGAADRGAAGPGVAGPDAADRGAADRGAADRGWAAAAEAGRALLDYAQRFMAAAIAEVPDGVYAFEDALDDDGAGTSPVPLRVVVTVAGDRATVDLRGCPPQVAGCVNCPAAVARSAAYYCFACLLEEGAPLNGGSFRNIDVLTMPGTVCDAVYPAAVVAGNTETSQRLVDVIFGALAQALPGRIPAASCGTMNSVALGGPWPAGADADGTGVSSGSAAGAGAAGAGAATPGAAGPDVTGVGSAEQSAAGPHGAGVIGAGEGTAGTVGPGATGAMAGVARPAGATAGGLVATSESGPADAGGRSTGVPPTGGGAGVGTAADAVGGDNGGAEIASTVVTGQGSAARPAPEAPTGWTYYETTGGGSGGGPGGPGASAVQCHMTNTRNTPAEALELQYPLRVVRFERDAGSGGAGRHRGGDGTVREIEALVPVQGTVLADRRLTRPYGLAGGSPGDAGETWVVVPGVRDELLPPKARFTLAPGDRLRLLTPGGGGWGGS